MGRLTGAQGSRVSARGLAPDVLSNLILTIGRSEFSDCLAQTVRRQVDPDIVGAYLITPQREMRVLFAEGGVPAIPGFSKIAAPRYAAQFWKDDPAVARFLASSSSEQPAMTLQRWNEIPGGEYRAFAYERPAMLERLSFFRAFSAGSILLSLYRTVQHGHFSSDDIAALERLSGGLVPATIRHCELVRTSVPRRPDGEALARQIAAWNNGLSPREIEVCAALLRESSTKEAMRVTGLAGSTFTTYRKRAFAKLGIRTRGELDRLYDGMNRSR